MSGPRLVAAGDNRTYPGCRRTRYLSVTSLWLTAPLSHPDGRATRTADPQPGSDRRAHTSCCPKTHLPCAWCWSGDRAILCLCWDCDLRRRQGGQEQSGASTGRDSLPAGCRPESEVRDDSRRWLGLRWRPNRQDPEGSGDASAAPPGYAARRCRPERHRACRQAEVLTTPDFATYSPHIYHMFATYLSMAAAARRAQPGVAHPPIYLLTYPCLHTPPLHSYPVSAV